MKKITLKNYEITTVVNILLNKDSILNSDEKKVPFSVLWDIDTNLRKLLEINKRIEEMRNKIYQMYLDTEHSDAENDENGNPTGNRIVKREYLDDFNSEMNELMMIDNEIEIATIPFVKVENFIGSGKDYQSIRFMVEKDVEVVEGTVE